MDDFSLIHYLITIIFFIILLISVILLTNSFNKFLQTDNQLILKARKYILSAITVGWASIIIIVVGLIWVGYIGYKGKINESKILKYIKYATKEEKLFASLRIVTFSILVIGSLIVGILCYNANKLLIKSNSLDYSKEIYITGKIAEITIFHTIILVVIQLIVFIIGYSYRFSVFL